VAKKTNTVRISVRNVTQKLVKVMDPVCTMWAILIKAKIEKIIKKKMYIKRKIYRGKENINYNISKL